ncbi:MAG TPA: glycosyltransferase, partial [Thermohalobaculum sp.]|nr:glycosyltransferase [Thermohalobaculum sp.]
MIGFTKEDLASIRASELFDAEWYLANNPDVRALGIDPAEHYLWLGARLGRLPSPRFDGEAYAARHLDAAVTDVNPLLHHLRRRGRRATAQTAPRAPEAPAVTPPSSVPAPLNASTYWSGRPFRYRPVEELRATIGDYLLERAKRPAGAPRIAFFSAICGGFETQKVHERLDPRVDYVLFVDRPTPALDLCAMRATPYHCADPRRAARFVKTHPHRLLAGYDVAVWLDSNIVIRGPEPYAMLDAFLASDRAVACIPHPRRSSVFEEGAECIARGMDDREILEAQLARYRGAGFDCDDLIETNLMMLKLRDPRVADFLDGWWAEIERGSRRDQISVNRALAQAKLDWLPLTEKRTSTRNHPDFALLEHDPAAGNLDEVVGALATGTFDPLSGPSFRSVRDRRLEAVRGLPVDIVVCVHDALDDVKLCLASLQAAKGHARQRIILVDDGSGAETAAFLAEHADAHDDVRLIRNEQAVGYTRAANIGLRASDAEVVIILNSDTIVTADWAEKMAEALLSTERGGIVGPMSNAASHQSIPDHLGTRDQTAINVLPPSLSPEDLNRACEDWSGADTLPLTPLVHGFCFGVSRSLIDAIGLFDEESFPRGYGEENDYCLRAADAGFALVVATHTYVFHAKSRSYVGPERIRLMQAGGQTLRTLHGRARVERAVASMRSNPVLAGLREAAAALYASATGTRPAAPPLPAAEPRG